jgi:hypothetical protein
MPVTETLPIAQFMSWIGGVDLFAATPGSAQPNVIVHLAREVTTPVGTAPSGLVFFQPDPGQPPLFAGFVSSDPKVGAYFGPKIFAGTPFESLPVLQATIEIEETETAASATIRFEGFEIAVTLSGFGPLQRIDRPVGAPMPFYQQGVECHATECALTVNGESIALVSLPYSLENGGSSVWSPGGTYSR